MAAGSVRAKFYVSEVTRSAHAPGQAKITLNAVSRGDGNARWSSATPSGNIVLQITNTDAVDALVLGQEYFIDFTPARAHQNPADGHAFRAADVPAGHYNSGKCGECSFSKDDHAQLGLPGRIIE